MLFKLAIMVSYEVWLKMLLFAVLAVLTSWEFASIARV